MSNEQSAPSFQGMTVKGFKQPLKLSDFKLIAFDMDSTLINIECIDEIADAAGRKAEVAAITEAAMRGEIADYKDSLRRRVALLKGVTVAHMEEVLNHRLQLNPGAENLVKACQAAGMKVLLVSGGFTFFTDHVKDRLNINWTRSNVDPVRARRVVGMVFQKPNPFPTMSISENVSSGLRLTGGTSKSEIAGIVEDSLRRAALWDEVKDKLNQPGTSLSGGQQQRLCIARTIAVKPRVVLMDEPCSALDPVATLKIEELIRDLAAEYTIVIVTHNMQQASRVSDETAFFSMDDDRAGYLVETGPTAEMFTNPKQALTEGYIQGRFG